MPPPRRCRRRTSSTSLDRRRRRPPSATPLQLKHVVFYSGPLLDLLVLPEGVARAPSTARSGIPGAAAGGGGVPLPAQRPPPICGRHRRGRGPVSPSPLRSSLPTRGPCILMAPGAPSSPPPAHRPLDLAALTSSPPTSRPPPAGGHARIYLAPRWLPRALRHEVGVPPPRLQVWRFPVAIAMI
jgi:hypothetical protein